ncbi:hypothetical protein DMUE_3977 [Dictyocoela muelleri]|nr:hypothetical protein DMUE_3977 [Dictyocoela muelleri]
MFHYKQKYVVGRISQENRCVFGIIVIQTIPSNFFVIVVPNRRQETLVPIVRQFCRAVNIIWSNQWSAYRALSYHFLHETVNHRLNFVNLETQVHTQNIESLWSQLKDKLRKIRGVSSWELQKYLDVEKKFRMKL